MPPAGNRKTEFALRCAIFAVYAAVTLLLVLRHEPWADELQAWLIARDCSIPEILRAMRWEGHFAPWYLMLHVFAANGAPVLCMNLLAWAFMAAAGGFFVFRAPFSLPMKALALCSSAMLFWYPVVARCYAPIPLLIFALAACWGTRLKRPLLFGSLIACLTNTHAYFEGFCGVVFILWAWDAWNARRELTSREIKRIAAGLCVAAVGALVGLAQVAPGVFGAKRIAAGLCVAAVGALVGLAQVAPGVFGALVGLAQVAPGVFGAQSVGNQRFWPMKMGLYERLATSFVDFAGCSKEVANVTMPILEYLWAALLLLLIAWLVRRWRTGLLYLAFAAVFFGAFWFALPPQDHPFHFGFQRVLDFIFLPFFAVAMLSMFRASRRMAFICEMSFLWMLFFAMFLFYFLPQRALLVFLTFLFCHWVLLENPEERNDDAPGAVFRFLDGPKPRPLQRLAEVLAVYVCFTIPACVSFVVQDFNHPFSGAKDMGEHLAKTLPPGSTVVLPFYGITDAVISAYAPGIRFFCVESGENITFCPLDWSKEKADRSRNGILPIWNTEVRDGQVVLVDQNGFMASPLWAPVIDAPGPHYFVCSMRFLQALRENTLHLQSKDRRHLFTEIYRSPHIPFTASAGEQYWLFSDELPANGEDVPAAADPRTDATSPAP